MVLNLSIIRQDFRRFNRLYFKGELKEPSFELRYLRRVCGLCYNSKIVISSYYSFPQRAYQNVLLHEMIHLYLRQSKKRDNKMHGKLFMRKADEINRVGGWEIKANADVRGFGVNGGKEVILCSYKDLFGRYFKFAISKGKMSYYLKLIKENKEFSDAIVFRCDDGRLFSGLSECRTRIRGFYISEKEHEDIKKKYRSDCISHIKAVNLQRD